MMQQAGFKPIFRLNSTATIEGLQEWSRNARKEYGDNVKIRGKENEDGSISLYVSEKHKNKFNKFKNFVTGHNKRRREHAREGLRNFFSFKHRESGIPGHKAKMTEELLSNILHGELRVGTFSQLIGEASRFLAFDNAMAKLAIPSITLCDQPAERIEIGGRQYIKTENLYSDHIPSREVSVDRYQADDNTEDEIVVKTQTINKKINNENLVAEMRAHSIALAGDDSNNYIVDLKGAHLSDSPDGPVMRQALEFAPGRSMESMIKKIDRAMEECKLTADEALTLKDMMLYDALNAIAYIHAQGVIHHDIKPNNFLIDKDGRVKICDFGASGLIDYSFPQEGMYVPIERKVDDPHWLAPESLKQKNKLITIKDNLNKSAKELEEKYGKNHKEVKETLAYRDRQLDMGYRVTPKGDIWSAGVTAFQLYQGRFPIGDGMVPLQVEKKLQEYCDKPELRFENLSDDRKELINGLMHPNENERLSLDDALQSPIFANVNEEETRQWVIDKLRELSKS